MSPVGARKVQRATQPDPGSGGEENSVLQVTEKSRRRGEGLQPRVQRETGAAARNHRKRRSPVTSLTLGNAPEVGITVSYSCSADRGASRLGQAQRTSYTATQPPGNSPTTSGTAISKAPIALALGIAFAAL